MENRFSFFTCLSQLLIILLLCFNWVHANVWGWSKAIFLEMQRGWMTRNIMEKSNWLGLYFVIWIKLNIWLNRFICKDVEHTHIYIYIQDASFWSKHIDILFNHAHTHYSLSTWRDNEDNIWGIIFEEIILLATTCIFEDCSVLYYTEHIYFMCWTENGFNWYSGVLNSCYLSYFVQRHRWCPLEWERIIPSELNYPLQVGKPWTKNKSYLNNQRGTISSHFCSFLLLFSRNNYTTRWNIQHYMPTLT